MPDDEPKPEGGFEEVQAPFTAEVIDLSAIFAAYDFRCAFTGQDLSVEAEADPVGWLLRLTSGSAGPTELIPANADAIYAFERGHLAIGPRYNFLVDLSTISPEFLERLNPIGKLTLPKSAALYPSTAALKAHRDEFAEGFIE
jgi:hypothetical protein